MELIRKDLDFEIKAVGDPQDRVLEFVGKNDEPRGMVQERFFRMLPHRHERHHRLGRLALGELVHQLFRDPEDIGTAPLGQLDDAFAVMLGEGGSGDHLLHSEPFPQGLFDHFYPFNEKGLFLLPDLRIAKGRQELDDPVVPAGDGVVGRRGFHGRSITQRKWPRNRG